MFGSAATLAVVALLPSAMAEWAKYKIKPDANHDLCIAPSSSDFGASLVLKNCDAEDTVFKYSSNSGKLKNIAKNICADVKDGVQADGTPAQLWGCTQCNRNQVWDFEIFGDLGFYHLKWNNSPYCLDLKDGKVEEGAEIQLWNCIDYNSNQKFIVEPQEDQPYCDEAGAIEGDDSRAQWDSANASEGRKRRLSH